LVQPSGKALLYDDTGEVVAAAQREGLDQRRAWVHDFGTEEWIDATQALYVASDDVRTLTPMGSGLVAFKTQAAAEAFRREHGGTLYRWDDVLASWRMPGAESGR
ncbi:MAG: nitrous oxide reductase accessory protein NosL, partial [Thermomicrobiaceae bacterium]|nr:nitrous oxide reductase accessory protein NosL [Thermomicrobiaceae bacterium]